MNKNFNKLPRGNISSGKISNKKYKYPINWDVITDNTGFITDSFTIYEDYGFQFSDFFNKVIQDKRWINKPRFLLESKKGKLFINTPEGNLKAFFVLASFYLKPSQGLLRLYQGFHDSAFVRLSLSSGFFTTVAHWEMVLNSWDNIISKVLWQYYKYVHPKYDPSTLMPYTVYFDTHFSKLFSLRIKEFQYQNRFNLEDAVEVIRLDQIRDSKFKYKDSRLYEDLSYGIEDFSEGII